MNPITTLTLSLLVGGCAGAQGKIEKAEAGNAQNPPGSVQEKKKKPDQKQGKEPEKEPEKEQEQEQEKKQEKAQDQKSDGTQDAKKADTPPAAPVDTLKLLQKSLESAQREEKFLREVAEHGGLLRRFLQNRALAKEMNQKFLPEEAGPMPAKKRAARLLGDEEKGRVGADVVFTVQSVPVTQKEFDAAVAYIKSYPRPDGTIPVETLAIEVLIEQKVGQGLFPKAAESAYEVMIEVAKRLQDGAKFGELAEKFSEDKATSANGGKCDAMTRGTMDKCYAMTAFGLNVGQVSAVVATRDGYEIIRLLGKKTGDKPENDSVLTARIVRHYTNDEKQRAQIESLIRSGSIDLAFRDDAMREFAPAQFK